MTRPPELPDLSGHGSRIEVQGQEVLQLATGWQAASTTPDACATAADTHDLGWIPATVPGTAAGALEASGAWRPGEIRDFDAEDWWFRTTFDAEAAGEGELVLLAFDGLATIAEVYLNGERVLESSSMFNAHLLDVGGRLRAGNELAICCRALGPRLGERRRPRARWRTRLVSDGNLRFFRTMLLGRTPGIAPETATVGPWRTVRLERRRGLSIEEVTLRPRLDGSDGVLGVSLRVSAIGGAPPTTVEVALEGPTGVHHGQLELRDGQGTLTAEGEIRVSGVAAWWPHTHGDPSLYRVRMVFAGGRDPLQADAGTVGFRTISAGAGGDVRRDGIDLHINGVRVFARGAIWTPGDLVGMAASHQEIRARLTAVRVAGMNMLRVPGTSAYETGVFHELCDELGILLWQDFMFANLDYPVADQQFRASVVSEARAVLARLAGHPSTAVLCGNSEVEQQAAMLGLDPSAGRGELFEEILPQLVRESGADAIYVPSSPCGGDLPFRPDRGIANYYGVGGYRRPLGDARRSAVRFAAECLAFSNVPDESALETPASNGDGPLVVGSPAWKAGVPRDVGAGWDFEDVRDHYLEDLFDVDARELRAIDPSRYLEMSRMVTGEVMAEVFGEWRREASPCGGALVLWLQDLAPGAGWGLLDSRGEPKAAYHYLRRALAPVAVWTVDEGLGGVVAHIANDTQARVEARLRVALYRDFELKVHEASENFELPPHSARERNVEEMLGHFVDAAWAYRFGPAGHDLIVASLESETDQGTVLLSQSARFPAGRPLTPHSAAELGLQARAQVREDGLLALSVKSRLLAYGVRVHVPGFVPDEDAFSVEPGGERTVMLSAHKAGTEFAGGRLSALNLAGRMPIEST